METISNEEKAKEIADKYYKMFDDCTLATGVEKGAIEMAEWKDEQFAQEKQQWIEKACDFFYDELNNGNMDCSDIECFIKKFKKNINHG